MVVQLGVAGQQTACPHKSGGLQLGLRRGGVNEQRIRQVLEVEQQAQAIYEDAKKKAEQLPVQAEQEAQELIEQKRAEAQAQAGQIIADAQAEEECARIRAQAEEDAARMEALAQNHFDHAVSYVLDRLIGRE
jgi:vacuolar-type H+-ATPase subunit H